MSILSISIVTTKQADTHSTSTIIETGGKREGGEQIKRKENLSEINIATQSFRNLLTVH